MYKINEVYCVDTPTFLKLNFKEYLNITNSSMINMRPQNELKTHMCILLCLKSDIFFSIKNCQSARFIDFLY